MPGRDKCWTSVPSISKGRMGDGVGVERTARDITAAASLCRSIFNGS
jgi:hypothetical protein